MNSKIQRRILHDKKCNNDWNPAIPDKYGLARWLRFIFLVALLLLLYFAASAQKITIVAKNQPLKEVLQQLRKQSGYAFIFSDQLMAKSKPVNITVKDKELLEALSLIFTSQPMTYEMNGKVITVIEQKFDRQPKKQNQSTIKGRVIDSLGNPLANVTIRLKSSSEVTRSNENGNFYLPDVSEGSILTFSLLGYSGLEVLSSRENMRVILTPLQGMLEEAVVNFNTGYQSISKDRATGSFVHIGNEALNRRVSTNVLDRLEGITSGMLFNANPVGAGQRSNITIRGASTIYANDKPLVILDNFEYNGDLSNINPNDILDITVLKDAAAASIWGAKSGNGVIVITTKRGSFNSPLTVNFNSNVTIGDRPDLFYSRQLSSPDYIEVERFLFNQKYYDSSLTDERKPALTPAVEIMLRNRNGEISASEMEARLDELKSHDVRTDIQRYLYRKSFNQQYSLNIAGGTQFQRFYISGGYDKNISNQRGNNYQRITLNANNTFSLLKDKLSVSTGINYTDSRIDANAVSGLGYGLKSFLYPYARLADEHGNALAIPKFRNAYIDTVGNGKLLDWQYKPLDEISNADNRTMQTNLLLNLDVQYKILKGLTADMKYQYGKNVSNGRNLQSQQTYYTRNYINQFSVINRTSGAVTRPVPLGSILDLVNSSGSTQNLRLQGNYNKNWDNVHDLSAVAGYEIRDFTTDRNTNRFYGYNDDLAIQQDVDYLTYFPLIYGTSRQLILSNRGLNSFTDRYRSVYANTSYTYLQKYTISGSARKDESNLFGVNTNQKSVPLWSTGVKWNMKKENFLKELQWLNQLQLRGSFGYSGNVDKNVTAYLTGYTYPTNNWGQPYTSIINPPNSDLRWERIRMINLGTDFSLFGNRLSGSFEYYFKKGLDIMGDATLAPSAGLPTYRGNTANIKGRGIDLQLNSQNTTGQVKWQSTFLLNYTTTSVTKYLQTPTSVQYYVSGGDESPIEGRPLFAIYSYKWAGLDASGNPRGYLDGNISTDWDAIENSPDLNSMVYNGPANPTLFGSFLNSICWHELSLSFNIIYKFGYYFKRPSLNYNSLLNISNLGDNEFAQRWQQPGDELKTTVPGMIYPTISSRDYFYQNSEIMVEKGDNIRLQDIQLSYRLDRNRLKSLPFRSFEVYGYLNNLGIICRSNKMGIDPDVSGLPNPKTYALGIKIGM